MKFRALLIFIVLAGLAGYGYTTIYQQKPMLPINRNMNLTYDVQYGKAEFAFAMKIEELNPDLVFRWQAGHFKRKSGVIVIKDEAMDSSGILYQDFNYQSRILSDSISMFLSKATYKLAKKTGIVNINTGNDVKLFKVLGRKKFDYRLDDDAAWTWALQLISDDGQAAIWVADNPEYPLILKYNPGMIMELKSIDTY